ncbi:MAG: hypothetical protein AAF351_03255 [Pseudomonadota bacterium]
MDVDKATRWLTLVANIGVLIGLVLLIVELRQNQELTRAQIHQSRTDAWVANIFERADTEYVAPVLMKFHEAGYPDNLDALEALSPLELRRMHDVLFAFHGDYDNMHYQYEQGFLDEEYYQARIVRSIKNLAPYWRKRGITGRPSFEKEIDRILAEQPRD